MSKRPVKSGVGPLTLQIAFPEGETNDGEQETEDHGPAASGSSPAVGSKPERKGKWYSLIDKVWALPNLQRAWQRVAANDGAAGADGMTVRKFAERAAERLTELSAELKAKSYRPQPVRRVFIAKAGAGKRPLGIPTVRDRIGQQALLQVLEPCFEPRFSRHSHGFRPEKGCATALGVVDQAVQRGYEWVVDADLQAFFDTVDHEQLLAALNVEIADGSVLRLVRQILKAGVWMPSTASVEPTEMGTPQGGPLSPLLANIYLHRFDQAMVAAGVGLVRYADDFVLFTKSEGEAAAALELARQVLEGELGLTLHPEKTRVVSLTQGFAFLGFHYFRDPKTGQVQKEVRAQSARRFREAIRRIIPRLRAQKAVKERHVTPERLAKNQRLGEMIRAVNRYLRGWHWYFKGVWSRWREPFEAFDRFVRVRLRLAITGRLGSGWWHYRIPNRLLHRLGLIPLSEWHRRYQTGQLAAPSR